MRYIIIVLLLSSFFSCVNNSEDKSARPQTGLQRPPNILLVMADDMGYSDLGCYGSKINTPNLDKLAEGGIRFTNFYNCAKCTPSRGALLTGKYPHEVGVGSAIAMPDKNYKPGAYQGYLDLNAVTCAEYFSENGYSTGMSGKWHLGEIKKYWPHTQGFEKYFGLISGASSFFEKIKEKRDRKFAIDSTEWTPPGNGPDFYFTDAITDYAIKHIEENISENPDKPFFEYVAYTAPHWPLHAPEEDIKKYAGKYDDGWAATRQCRWERLREMRVFENIPELPPPPASIPKWGKREKQLDWARRMEVHAAMVDRMDQNIGRLVESLKKNGQYENTIILFLSDNGASAEDIAKRNLHDENVPIGLKGSYLSFCEPWANVSNVPFRNYKLKLWEGGISTPLIVHWPKNMNIKRGEIRRQNAHLIDILPTLIDLSFSSKKNADIEKLGLTGKSLADVVFKNKALERPLFWEYNGHRAMRLGDWKLILPKNGDWQLYDMGADRSEMDNLAEAEKEKLEEMIAAWEVWANKVGVYDER